MKKLIIAEKPSLAKNIIAAIGTSKCTKQNGYYESDKYIITWAFGHLFSLINLDEYDTNYDPKQKQSWTLDNLPFIPKKFIFKLKSDPKTKQVDKGIQQQFRIISALIHRPDVSTIINAGDSDREGEIIIRIILENADNKKPVERLWMPDQTPETIQSELNNVRLDSEYNNLANEGYARTFIDWLYGINLTRYASIKSGKLLRVGRVTSPIVKAIYDRDMAIKNFIPVKYYGIVSKEKTNGEIIELTSKKEFSKDELANANELCTKYNSADTVVSDAKTEKKVIQPGKLYSLSKLQGVLGRLYKLSPQKTLEIVQSLYESGYVTYPRTNTEYLATAEKSKVKAIIEKVADSGYPVIFKDKKSIFDDSKIESHSALTPTTKIPTSGTLSPDEQKVYDVILKHFVAVFCAEDCIVDRSTIIIDNGYETFTLKGDVMIQPGWTKYDINEKKDKILPALSVGDKINVNFKSVDKETKPPKHYTTETFNNFLKNPFRKENKTGESDELAIIPEDDDKEKDEEYAAILSGAELGTEATRAGLIDAAIKSGYILLKENVYYITDVGIYYTETLEKLFIDMSKNKTVQLGKTLKNIYKGVLTINDGISITSKEINEIFSHQNEVSVEKFNDTASILCKCPKCGCDIQENSKAFTCSNKDCGIVIFKNDKFFEKFGKQVPVGLAKILFTKGRVKVKGLKSPKTGNKFDAFITVTFEDKYPKYEISFDGDNTNSIGPCPKCGCDVIETINGYKCTSDTCKFMLWADNKFLGSMGKKITPQIAGDLLKNKEAKVNGLLSKKGKKFNAIVCVDFDSNPNYPQFSLKFL